MFANRCFSCADAIRGSPMTSPTKKSLDSFFILACVGGEGTVNRSGCSGTPLIAGGNALLLAFPACDDAAKRADDADKCPAVITGIPFRRTLLVAAGPANHRVTFA
jgi:hypothetical protein